MGQGLHRRQRAVRKCLAVLLASGVATPAMLVASSPAAGAAPLVGNPPLANTLTVTVTTGPDGLAAPADASLAVGFTDGRGALRQSLNNKVAWPANSTRSVVVSLRRHVLTSEIAVIRLDLSGSDSWDVNTVTVDARSAADNKRIVWTNTPFTRLTPSSSGVQLPFRNHTAAARPSAVDLRPYQTPMKSQGSRNTCIAFSATAAIEAAYKRQGYGDLDLSEEFLNYTNKTFTLFDRNNVPTAAAAETQLATTDGGNGFQLLNFSADGLRVPRESVMPYRSTPYTRNDHPLLANGWDSDTFKVQKAVSDVNLSRLLPYAARSASSYYGVTNAALLTGAEMQAQIESVLAANREVVVGFSLPQGAHSVLVVGYDRTDPANPVFYVKDSGGFFTTNQRVPYNAIMSSIGSAGFIVGVRTPGPWAEMSFVGRWNLDFDGWRGQLDIYHVPGIAQRWLAWYGLPGLDRRVGTFYDHDNKAHRVNGSMSGNGITFYIDGADPNLPYSKLSGRRFTYWLMKAPSGFIMSGSHTDPGGGTFGGYARRDAPVGGGVALASPLSVASYRGSTFATTWRNLEGSLRLDGTSTPHPSNSNLDLIRGTFEVSGTPRPVNFTVDRTNPSRVTLSDQDGGTNWNSALKLSWEGGILAGQGLVMIKTA